MNREIIDINIKEFPSSFRALIDNAAVYDSSCSKEAKVYFIDRDGGYYLKKSEKGALKHEAEMTRFSLAEIFLLKLWPMKPEIMTGFLLVVFPERTVHFTLILKIRKNSVKRQH